MIKANKLKNGLTVVSVPKPDTQAVTVMLLVPVGSRFETPSINGISHFLEHLMFKGTKKRPSTLEITKLLDGVGAEYNAYTGKDHTAYYIKVAADHFELTLDLFSDMLFNSLFDKQEIDRERGVIVEELNMYNDNPMFLVETLMETSVFHKDHPLGYDIGGIKKNIRAIPRSSFISFKKNYYFPGNMHLVVAGKLPANKNRLINKYFGQYSEKHKKKSYKKFNDYQTGIQLFHKYKDTEQTQVSIGFLGLPYNHKDMPALSVLAVILGGNMSSRLFINIREREGLCYVIRADISPYHDTGVFSVHAGLDKTRLDSAIVAIIKELKLIKDEPVSDDELSNAKEYLKGQTALKLEDSSALASWYGKQSVLTGKLITPEVKLKQIENVTKRDVTRVANKIFRKTHINIASIGPYKSTTHLKRLIDL
ncbi:MAG: pitrilysin family protein [bacterium]|nr:pitrilysin family protein [bacterium]